MGMTNHGPLVPESTPACNPVSLSESPLLVQSNRLLLVAIYDQPNILIHVQRLYRVDTVNAPLYKPVSSIMADSIWELLWAAVSSDLIIHSKKV
jgi:hypothetical protein